MNLQPLPIGTSDFSALRSAGQTYVDKTEFVYELASERQPELPEHSSGIFSF
ncbi:AAA family ATPase [Parasutterella excrementihominis]|uniref:AAA family ATPase n=1 Tax=Parasutterella excrementihominis TaxID=487175 RepID=UPI002673001C|nr:AAA family ATPase [Parasutterella excrementihominis]